MEELRGLQIGPDNFLRVRTGLNKYDGASAPTQGFYAQRTCAGEEIENVHIGEGKATGKDVEHRLSDSVGGGPDFFWNSERQPTHRARDDTHLDAKNMNG